MFTLRFVLLFLTWCAFSGLFDALHLGLGVLACLWVSAISSHLSLTETSRIPTSGRFWQIRLIGYGFWLVLETIKANIMVFRLSLSPKLYEEISPTVIEFRTRLIGEFPRFLLAHSITLTPGGVTIRVDSDRYTVHTVTKEIADSIPGEMEERLLKVFGQNVPPEELTDG